MVFPASIAAKTASSAVVPVVAANKSNKFSKHFEWGMEREEIPALFEQAGWKASGVSVLPAEEQTHGREMAKKALFFVLAAARDD